MRKSVLCVLMMLLLGCTGCGRGAQPDSAEEIEGGVAVATYYKKESAALPFASGYVFGSCTDGRYIYYLQIVRAEGDRVALCRVSVEDGTAQELMGYSERFPLTDEARVEFVGPAAGPEGALWIWEQMTGQESSQCLRKIDAQTGEEAKLISLDGMTKTLDGESVRELTLDGQGNFFLATDSRVLILNGEGELLAVADWKSGGAAPLPAVFSGGKLACLSDGRVAMATAGRLGADNAMELRVVDERTGEKGESFTLPKDTRAVYGGEGEYLFFYQAGEEFYGHGAETNADDLVFSCQNAGVHALGVNCFAQRETGVAALAVINNSTDLTDPRIEMLFLEPGEATERKVLVYGTLAVSERAAYKIRMFNQESQDYYIEIRDYSGGRNGGDMSYEDFAQALTRLQADLVSGNGPDLIDKVGGTPLHTYGVKGLLENLWPYIEQDPELGRDAVMAHVLECAETDGKLYWIAPGFWLHTTVARTDMVGDRMGWTLDEVMEAYEAMPEGSSILGQGCTPEGLLSILVEFNVDRWIDWKTGECSFDTPEFRRLMEMCALCQGGEDEDFYEPMQQGRQLMQNVYLSHPWELQWLEEACASPEDLMDYEGILREHHLTLSDSLEIHAENVRAGRFGGPPSDHMAEGMLTGDGYMTYAGYPAEEGVGAVFRLWGEIAMTSSCKDKEGAWSFLRNQLLPGGEAYEIDIGYVNLMPHTDAFPINRADFEAQMAEIMTPVYVRDEEGEIVTDKNGEPLEEAITAYPIGRPVSLMVYRRALSQAQYDKFMRLYDATDRVEYYDQTICDIVEEESVLYFNGDKSMDETIDVIQKRIGLYVNEQR